MNELRWKLLAHVTALSNCMSFEKQGDALTGHKTLLSRHRVLPLVSHVAYASVTDDDRRR